MCIDCLPCSGFMAEFERKVKDRDCQIDPLEERIKSLTDTVGFPDLVSTCSDLVHKKKLGQVEPFYKKLLRSQEKAKEFVTAMGKMERSHNIALSRQSASEGWASQYRAEVEKVKSEKDQLRYQIQALEARYAGARL